jgi:hypothetical protein
MAFRGTTGMSKTEDCTCPSGQPRKENLTFATPAVAASGARTGP